MTRTADTGYSPEWLALREPADAAARAGRLLEPLREHLARDVPGGRDGLVIRDLGCGTGSMGRWLAGRLTGPQRWLLHDRDPELLRRAAAGLPGTAADGRAVTAVARRRDITRLRARDLAGTSLVTASALLDLLTADEVDGLAAACAAARCPALLTLSVVGRVELEPAEELDTRFAAAFDDHQRRTEHGRRLLGPDAVDSAVAAFGRHGATVLTQESPWRLAAGAAELTRRWLDGWVAAACEQRPELAVERHGYLDRRLRGCDRGTLRVAVHHRDLLALPI